MNCDEISAQLEVFFDGATTPALKEEVEAHLSACPACDASLEQLQAIRKLLRRSVIPMPTASLDVKVMGAFHARRSRSQAHRAGWRELIFGSILIPKPLVTMSLPVVVVALLVGFQIGRKTATQIATPDPSRSIVSLASTPPANITEGRDNNSQTASRDEPPRYRPRQPAHRTRRAKSSAAITTMTPIESFATVSPSTTTYSTRASLSGFEPLSETKVRVLKGDEQR
jgi:anti-sigma factor RsiW